MTSSTKNPFLSMVMQQLRQERPLLNPEQRWFNRVERVPAGNYVELWFLTQGCTWDQQGGCTMCNYGHGLYQSEEALVDSVQKGLAAIQIEVDELLVSPSGGMFDPREVPVEARKQIYALVRNFPTKSFLIETRPETVTEDALTEIVTALPGKRIAIELGLESSCPWIGRFCVNRGHTPAQFTQAVDLIRRHGIASYGNISLGTAFLTPAEAIQDAVRTIRWALDIGVTSTVVFPLHIKPNTLLEQLYSMELYTPPSLWSLVEVLKQCADEVQRMEIAWYRSYYDDDEKIRRSPGTCSNCHDTVLALLDRYRAEQSMAAIEALDAIDCTCRSLWRQQIEETPHAPLPDRVLRTYQRLTQALGLQTWWSKHGMATQANLASSRPLVMECSNASPR